MATNEPDPEPGMHIEDDRWIECKRSMTREDFVRRYHYPFVLLLGASPDEDLEFQTQTMTGREQAPSLASRVLPLRDGGKNPYKGRIIVGRTHNCDVTIRSGDISKYHADFRVESGSIDRAVLRDRGSSNGTKVGDRQLEPNESVVVRSKDRIRFGATQLIFLSPSDLWDML